MSNIILKNCKTIDNKIINLIIEDGKIKKITKQLLSSDKTTDKIINIKENIIIPGLIDTHVHLRDPGLTHKENWTTGSQAAAHGGYTTIIDMPNTSPLTNTLKNFKEKKEIAKNKSYVDYALHAGVKTQKDVNEILEEKPASYKIFMDLHNNNELFEMFKYVSKTGKPLSLHCEDKTLVDYNIKTLSSNPENDKKTITYSYARSALAELIAVNRAIEYAKQLNLQLHLCHISTRQTLELIREARTKINISIEATPHHIFLDNSTYETYGIKAKTNPPLRDENYNINIEHMKEFDSIGTDHAPHTLEEKLKNTWNSAAGIPGLENTLPLLLTEVNNNNITLQEVVRLMSTNPAKIFKIPNKGEIKVGYDADITVIDMKLEGKIDTETFYTKGKYTPFEEREYTGKNIMTINRGNIICENDEVIKCENKYVY
ncbi:dihydroorotase family protein [Methanosphaera sp. ISO3-F5]|uniref:dihydroorotase n=1 Tax=Methanosphaera sp. ISO3-F5 TaxID=1452353 RepID=UPI002B258351|nr:dihydroorotase family protein [Methanosphaera sp. ISO3-F5]WQH65211.1 dihydroorotase family protein [Methanosphaera sp. ISO3-F5]